MDRFCGFRADPETERMLLMLAKRGFRNRSDLLRLLIHLAARKPELLFPDLAEMEAIKGDNVEEKPLVGGSEVKA